MVVLKKTTLYLLLHIVFPTVVLQCHNKYLKSKMSLDEICGELKNKRKNYSKNQTCQLQKFKIGRLWFSTLWKLGDFNQNREIL